MGPGPRSIDRAQCGIVLAREKREGKAGGCKHMGIIRGGCDRLPRDADSLVNLWTGDRDPMARSLQGPAAANQRHGWGVARIEFERALQQPNRFG